MSANYRSYTSTPDDVKLGEIEKFLHPSVWEDLESVLTHLAETIQSLETKLSAVKDEVTKLQTQLER